MRALLLGSLTCLWISGCSACETPPDDAPEPTAEEAAAEGSEEPSAAPTDEEAPENVAPENEAPERPSRGATARERAERLQSLPADERARLRQRTELLGQGRTLGREGDHQGALSAFEAALRLAPLDVTVMCEAGYQALRLERYDAAAAHLEPAVRRSALPRTAAMCFYNLGRVREAQGRLPEAARNYTDSLALRPNRVVQDRLDALDVVPAEDDMDMDLGPEMVDTRALAGRHFRRLDALAAAAGCASSGSGAGSEVPPVPSPSASMRELALYECEDEEMREYSTFLCVRSDAGWAYVDAVATSDMGDRYGRLEVGETASVVYDEGQPIVLVSGGLDERDGEAEAYWGCENEHEDDHEAAMDCFDEATADLEPPESWTNATRYTLQDGELVGEAIEDPEPYFDALEDGG